jgi:hypothetical protein
MIDKLFNQYIGRLVAFVLVPVLLPVTGAVAKWLQDVVGVNLTGDQLTAYIVTTVVGVAAVAFKWLSNRGAFEIAAIENVVAEVYATGDALPHVPVTLDPPADAGDVGGRV